MRRDDEIKRLVLYLKACNVKVTIRDYAFDHMGEVTGDFPVRININKHRHTSKTELVLTLLHEACHIKYSSLHPDNTFNGLETEENGDFKPATKKQRYENYEFEHDSLQLMPELALELGITIPVSKIEMQRDLDIWEHWQFYVNNRYPNKQEHCIQKKKLKVKYNI